MINWDGSRWRGENRGKERGEEGKMSRKGRKGERETTLWP